MTTTVKYVDRPILEGDGNLKRVLYGYSDLSTNLGSHLLRDTNHT